MKSIIEKIKAFFAKLFGKKTAKPVAVAAPAAPLSGAALAAELNKQSNAAPLSGAALAEQLNAVPVPATKKTKTTKKITKKTSKKKA